MKSLAPWRECSLRPARRSVEFNTRSGYVVSAVQIVGDWQGAVRLDIDLELARQACANLVGLEPGDLSAQDIRDAAGELANMAGGSVKALCSPTSRLSLPSVAMGRDFEFTVSQGTVVQQLSFLHASRRPDGQRDREAIGGGAARELSAAQECKTRGRFQCRHTATTRSTKQTMAPAKVVRVGGRPALSPATMTAAPASAATA